MFNQTNKEVFGLKERRYENVRFLHKKGNNKLICFFSSLVSKNKEQQYHNLKKFINREESYIWFLDYPLGRGSYFIDSDNNYLSDVNVVITYIENQSNISEVIFAGSSKGGTGAILAFLTHGKGVVFSHAPQYFIKDFLDIDNQDVIDNISSSNINNYLGYYLDKNRNFIEHNKSKLFISCGLSDGYHLRKQIPFLFDNLEKNNFNMEFIPVYGGHDGQSIIAFQNLLESYLDNKINSFISKNINLNSLLYYNKSVSKVIDSKMRDIVNQSFIEDLLSTELSILSIENSKFLLIPPHLLGVSYALYYRDNLKTYKFLDYRIEKNFLMEFDKELREITLFLKCENNIFQKKFDMKLIYEIVEESRVLNQKKDLDICMKSNLKEETSQIEALFNLHQLITILYPLPKMRNWAISPDFALLLIEEILKKEPKVIVELGSGVSTIIIGYILKKINKGKLISIEHDPIYLAKTQENLKLHKIEDYIDLQLISLSSLEIDKQEYNWYNINDMSINDAIDILIVDGPPARLCKNARYPALPIFINQLEKKPIIIMDDAIRKEEKDICRQWLEKYPQFKSEYIDTEKGCFILRDSL